MKISKRDQGLLLILLGIVVLLAGYLGVYKNFSEKADNLSAENQALAPRLRELEDHYSNIPVYEEDIKEISEQVERDIKAFPSDVRPEDLIVYGDRLEKELGLTASQMSFSPPELVSQFSVPQKNESGEIAFLPYAALSTNMSISVNMSYKQMLDFVDYVYKKSKRTTLDSISVSYNSETGGLAGTAVMTKYFMSGSEYEYEPTKLPEYKKGVDNPFGTITVKKDESRSD